MLQFQGSIQAVEANEAPELAEALSELSLPKEQVVFIATLFYALGDMVEANNDAIATQVAHIDK